MTYSPNDQAEGRAVLAAERDASALITALLVDDDTTVDEIVRNTPDPDLVLSSLAGALRAVVPYDDPGLLAALRLCWEQREAAQMAINAEFEDRPEDVIPFALGEDGPA